MPTNTHGLEEEVSSNEIPVADEKDKIGSKHLTEKQEASIHEVPLPTYTDPEELSIGKIAHLVDAGEIVTHVIHVDDDPSLSPWTFRMFFIGKPEALLMLVLQMVS